MESGWRKQLFNQKQSQSGVNPLVLPMSKAKAVKILGICPRTLERWAKVASLIPEYRLILVRMQALAQEKNLRAAPITSYQVWVVGKIGELFGDITQGIDKKALVEAIVEVMEARTLRGKDPQQAKHEFEDSKQYTLGTKPTGNIDLTVALWGDYKAAGMKERHTGGAIALFFWVLDITTTFVGRNPFRYTNPAAILGCFAYNCASMMAGEIGYNIWKLTK